MTTLDYRAECDLCARTRAGDETARNDLVLANLPLVKRLARRRAAAGSSSLDVADLMQEGVFGVIRAAEKFDPAAHPGVRFSAYARMWIRHYMNKAARVDVLRVPTPRGSGAVPPRRVPLGDPPVRPARRDDGLAAAVAELPMIQRFAVGKLFGLDGDDLGGRPPTCEDLAAEVGCSTHAMQAIRRTAMDRLRTALVEADEVPIRASGDRHKRGCAFPEKCNPNRRTA